MYTNYFEEDMDDQLILSDILPEDVEQEAQLRMLLTGKKIHRGLVRASMKRELLISFSSSHEREMTPVFTDYVPSFDTFARIIEWCEGQNAAVQDRIHQFLENPSEEELTDLLRHLRSAGLIASKPAKSPKATSASLTQLVIRALRQPQPLEELYALARSSVKTERPEASIRQILRRLTRQGTIQEIAPRIYFCPATATN